MLKQLTESEKVFKQRQHDYEERLMKIQSDLENTRTELKQSLLREELATGDSDSKLRILLSKLQHTEKELMASR